MARSFYIEIVFQYDIIKTILIPTLIAFYSREKEILFVVVLFGKPWLFPCENNGNGYKYYFSPCFIIMSKCSPCSINK